MANLTNELKLAHNLPAKKPYSKLIFSTILVGIFILCCGIVFSFLQTNTSKKQESVYRCAVVDTIESVNLQKTRYSPTMIFGSYCVLILIFYFKYLRKKIETEDTQVEKVFTDNLGTVCSCCSWFDFKDTAVYNFAPLIIFSVFSAPLIIFSCLTSRSSKNGDTGVMKEVENGDTVVPTGLVDFERRRNKKRELCGNFEQHCGGPTHCEVKDCSNHNRF